MISTVGKPEELVGVNVGPGLSGRIPLPAHVASLEVSHKLHNDPQSIQLASSDYGNLHHHSPLALFRPSSLNDVVSLVRASYASRGASFGISARGQGHSTRGQAMAPNGVVVEMGSLRNSLRNRINVSYDKWLGYYADVGGEQLWSDVLDATLAHGVAPVSWTDYLYLTIGGTLSNAGISGQTFRYGPQISNVHELDVLTGNILIQFNVLFLTPTFYLFIYY